VIPATPHVISGSVLAQRNQIAESNAGWPWLPGTALGLLRQRLRLWRWRGRIGAVPIPQSRAAISSARKFLLEHRCLDGDGTRSFKSVRGRMPFLSGTTGHGSAGSGDSMCRKESAVHQVRRACGKTARHRKSGQMVLGLRAAGMPTGSSGALNPAPFRTPPAQHRGAGVRA